jgi:hypothetical protein
MEKENKETPEYNTDMTETQSKKVLRELSQSLINEFTKDEKYKVNQYKANIYANIISKNLLPKWAKGFNKFRIILDSYQSFHTLEFLTPSMTQEFASRFVHGRESLGGLIHRSPEIKIKMSPRIFHGMKDPDDAYNFFKAAIKYYDSQVDRASHRLMAEVMRLGTNMKHLIGNSRLSGLVTYPLSLLFIFNDVDITNKETFKIKDDDIQAINKFVKNISSRYAAPEKEKAKIIEDLNQMITSFRESEDPIINNCEAVKYLYDLPEAVNKLYSNSYNDLITELTRIFINQQIDTKYEPNKEVKYLMEKYGVKKLKKIPSDLIAYISIETEEIKDANDKLLIASYCANKLDIVDWYIELLQVGSDRYIVPHTLPYLQSVRIQLLDCLKKIMDAKTVNSKERPIIDIKYPTGYEG